VIAQQRHRVLLVDDDAFIVRAHTKALTNGGFDVTSALSGELAVEAVPSALGRFAVAIVDLRMIGMDGITTIEKLRALDPDLQFVLCTGEDLTPHQLASLTDADSLIVLRKPASNVELVQVVHALAVNRLLALQQRTHVDELEAKVLARTAELEAANRELAAQLAWRERLEAELKISQRLEAVGQLAAGVAHEISSPIQYVNDNIQFLRDGSLDVLRAIDTLNAAIRERGDAHLIAVVDALESDVDLEYLRSELPRSAESMQRGVQRIATIVGAMRQLSHPGSEKPCRADLNRTLENALEVTSSAYKYIAHVERELGDIPAVTCHAAELGQVFINLIINASHAMEGMPGEGVRGTLRVRTAVDGADVVVSVADTGCGIPDAIRHKVFDTFFTTKEVGRGTGQGLAIARSIVVDRHHGKLTFESVVGRGTTFEIRLPIDGAADAASASVAA
jgi:two-component system, NtrC family, sensor kinase